MVDYSQCFPSSSLCQKIKPMSYSMQITINRCKSIRIVGEPFNCTKLIRQMQTIDIQTVNQGVNYFLARLGLHVVDELRLVVGGALKPQPQAERTRRGIGICWAIKKPITFKYSGDRSGKSFSHQRQSAKLGVDGSTYKQLKGMMI